LQRTVRRRDVLLVAWKWVGDVDGADVASLAELQNAVIGREKAVASNEAPAASQLSRVNLLDEIGARPVRAQDLEQDR